MEYSALPRRSVPGIGIGYPALPWWILPGFFLLAITKVDVALAESALYSVAVSDALAEEDAALSETALTSVSVADATQKEYPT